SGNYVPKGCGKRQIKSQGSCKSGKICLASIEVFITSNSIIVKYHKNHCGHDFSLAHIHLSDSEKAVIAGILANGVILQRILDDIRDTASNELYRIHLVTRKDLQNIKCAYNLQEKKKYHPEDKFSVQLWVDKMKSLEQCPVLYFKQQGEVDAQQKLELLKMLEQQMICVDSTHGTTAYDFYLSTILTLNEFGIIDSIQWQVKSQSITNSIYVVEKKNENIEDHTRCKLLCNKCNVCVHVYSCTCPDYEVSLNMCKHIHAVIKIEKETSNRNATNELSCDILADDPNTLFKSVENYRVCISKETKTIDQSSEYCELEKNLNAVHAIVKKRKLNKIQMCELNTFLNDWLRKISVESSFNINSSTTCNNIPANKNITKQTRYKSTKQKSKKRDSAYSMKKPSEAQKENIQKMMQNKGESVLEIHTDNDHVY
ncbi:uncharacterized protein, partial [Centruroides vittatus]|uniref:uncharacterized protein n=1 Tax=Centruroides vittatus TaxID=120091 RepID=UPI00350F7104